MLSPEDESRAVTEVVQRLALSYPELPPDVVEHTVQASHERFAGSPIRDFVPVLVERMAKSSLAQSALS
jgi:hypothetical protein